MKKVHFDTSIKAFLTNEKGDLILDESRNPVPIAFDLVSGKWFKRLHEAVSHADPAELSKKHQALHQVGAVHVGHHDSFQGWWIPTEEPTKLHNAGDGISDAEKQSLAQSQVARRYY